MAVPELGLIPMPQRSPVRLERRIGVVIVVQLALAIGFASLAVTRGAHIGSAWTILALTGAFVVTGSVDISLELHRHRFTITPADSVLVIGVFVAGPIGLAFAFAAAEAVNMTAHRRGLLKTMFNVSNRLVAVTIAAMAFAAIGHTSVQDMSAWIAALVAAVCFSIIDVVGTSVVVAMAEELPFHDVFVRSASTGVLATLAAAPIGLLALDLYSHSPFAVLLVAPLAVAVALNSRYAVAQRDEHLRFERLYQASARTAGLLALNDALRTLAAETRALATGRAAIFCATDVEGNWVGAWADDRTRRLATPEEVGAALGFAAQYPDHEVGAADAPEIAVMAAYAGSALAVSSVHDKAGRVVLVVLRDGTSTAGTESRVETLGAFANHAALIVANALLHEERAIALARQVDLNRQKDDFIAAVSHELRTPLAVMLGSVHTLDRLNGRMSDEQRAQLFDMTVEQGGRLQRLIDELLLVAAAEHSSVPIDIEAVDIAELFASVELDTAKLVEGRLVQQIDGVTDVVTDQSKLARILLNLVENAAKYATTGSIELAARQVGGSVCFTVVDHGSGIPAEDQDRVFERFVQLDQSSTRRQGGTGLGLHLCRQLADVLDGSLSVTETEGGGCTFELVLPVRVEEPAARMPAVVVRERPQEFHMSERVG